MYKASRRREYERTKMMEEKVEKVGKQHFVAVRPFSPWLTHVNSRKR